MRISIVIPTYNRCDSLIKFFEALKEQKYKDFEVILADAGSDDGTSGLEKKYSSFFSVKYVCQPGDGFVDAVNTGLKLATGDIFLRTDDDVIPTPEWLSAIEDTFISHKNIGGVTGPVVTPENNLQNRDLFSLQNRFKKGNFFWKIIGKFYYDYLMEGRALDIGKDLKCGAFTYGANFPQALKLEEIIEVDHHESCNMAVRKDLLEKIGGFDESFIKTSEYCDSDIAYKIKDLGFINVFNPKAIIYHFPSKQGFFSKRFDSYHRIENFIRFYYRHIKPDSFDKIFRFLSYLGFLNGYFLYIFLTTGKIEALGSFPSTIINLIKYSIKIFSKGR